MEREVARIKAKADNGKIYTVVTIQEFIEATAISDTSARWIKGMKRLELEDGSPVNYVDDKTFEIVTTDQIIRAV